MTDFHTYLDGVSILHGTIYDTREESLCATLNHCLSKEDWHAVPDAYGLYPFLAECVQYPALNLILQNAMSMWPKERRQALAKMLEGVSADVSEILIEQPMSDVEPVDVSWLWEPYVPLGMITLLEGHPGTGKTFLSLMLAASVADGLALPDEFGQIDLATYRSPATCLYISHEDSLGATIRKRLDAIGVSEQGYNRIMAVRGWKRQGSEIFPFTLDKIELLEHSIGRHQARLVIIDPITDFINAKVDIYRQNEVAPLLSEINRIAEKYQCAFLLVRHWTKGVGSGALGKGMGSVGFAQKARSILVVGQSPDDMDVKVVAHAKHNLSECGESQAFSLTNGIFGWIGTSDISADELALYLPNGKKRQSQSQAKVDAAKKWLLATLKERDYESNSILLLGDQMGHSRRTLERARNELKNHIQTYQSERVWFLGLRDRDAVAGYKY